jgi:hypothetical protein
MGVWIDGKEKRLPLIVCLGLWSLLLYICLDMAGLDGLGWFGKQIIFAQHCRIIRRTFDMLEI